MKELRATVLVGLLAVVSVALVIFGVLNANRGIGGEGETWLVQAVFDDVTGIAAGTKVTIAGYPVGEVAHVALRGTRVIVQIRVRNDVVLYAGVRRAPEGPLRNAAMVTRVQASLLGDYYLELKPGAEGEKIAPGGTIPLVVTATGIEATLARIESAADIIPKIDQIAGDIGKITANAAKVFGSDDGAKRFDEIADNLVQSSRHLVTTAAAAEGRLVKGTLAPGGELDRSVRDVHTFIRNANALLGMAGGRVNRGTASALRSLDHVEDITRSVRAMIGRNEKGVENAMGTLTSTLRKVEDSLVRVDRVVGHLEALAAATRRGEGSVGRLLTSDKLVRETEAMVSETRGFVSRFVSMQSGIDFQTSRYAGLPGTDADAWRSQLTLRLQPSPEKYYLVTVSSDIIPLTAQRAQRTSASVDGAPATQLDERIAETGDTVKLGFQYVRRWGPLALRGGVIESRAGGGVDLFAWNDRVQWTTDLFALTDPRPRLRTALMVRLLPFAYLQVGGDMLLTADRDLFFGAGLAFTDNDLILLFASAPSVQF
jgi:phospholipid/cholesterol/gamma-HCH transport system substrate-binding protein